jgi:signal transduction histidine kinase/ABC-type amino acid transport substrate-binding protein/ActR/RegA family two-component response regulator
MPRTPGMRPRASRAQPHRAILLLIVAFFGFATASPARADTAAPQRTYTVGVLDDNPPFSFRDADGQIKGYAVDLLAAVEAQSKLRLERRVGSTSEINVAFERGELDMLQSYVRTEKRDDFADFSVPYLRMNGHIFVRRAERAITRLEDLRGRRVMVHAGSMGEKILRDERLDDSIVIVGSVEEALRNLDAGTGDATLVSRLTAMETVRRLNLRNVVAVPDPVPGYTANYRFAVREDLGELITRVDDALLHLDEPDKSGISPRQQIYDRWFGFADPRKFDSTQIAIAVSSGLGLALAVAVWAMLRQRRLRHQIARQADALRASEEGYRTVFESTLHGLIVFEHDPSVASRWVIVQLNPATRRILGEPAASGARPTFAEAFPVEGTLAFRLEGALTATKPEPFEHDRSRPGLPAWVEISVSPLGENRRLVAMRDITESRIAAERLRESEARLRQNQKLEAIGTLASGIAHDFNNVLTAIVGNLELLRLDLGDNHEASPALQEIREAAERARLLVRQILAFSRRAESRREVLQVTRLVKETLRFVSATAPSTIEFQHRVGERSPSIEIDPTQLHQVLMNLCTNAVHAMRGRSGVIEIAEDGIDVQPGAVEHPHDLKPGEYLMLSVRDNGTGMPPEILQHIFDPFFTTKAAGEGTGLGLSVVHGIVTGSGGAVDVTSAQGFGTTFRLYFPASSGKPAPGSAGEADVPAGHGERILFVDDEPAIVSAASGLLQRLGYVVTSCTQPVEALAEFTRRPQSFDVVVTDLTMPKMSGIELAGHIRSRRPELPVILISGFINDREMALARVGRITHLLDKPLTTASLGRAVAAALAHRQQPTR